VSIEERLAGLRARIDQAARRAQRDPAGVHLLAVTKSVPAERVAEAVRAGLRVFGESRVQEAEQKIPRVAEQSAPAQLSWHWIGRLQRNKVRRAVQLFRVIESMDRVELAHALERAACERAQATEVFLQVNVDREPQKAGVLPEHAAQLAERVASECPHLRATGLMAIPQAHPDPQHVRSAFARLRALRDELRERLPHSGIEELSMGMSEDFELAIEEGATWIRVGSALFGAREAL
jgi:pyridoxal phosphate enzyme (YggS family)